MLSVISTIVAPSGGCRRRTRAESFVFARGCRCRRFRARVGPVADELPGLWSRTLGGAQAAAPAALSVVSRPIVSRPARVIASVMPRLFPVERLTAWSHVRRSAEKTLLEQPAKNPLRRTALQGLG